MMPEHEDAAAGAVPYAPSAAVHPALPGGAVEVHPFFGGDDEGEAARVVELVAGVRQRAPDDTVAVLVRNRNHLQWIVPRLRAARLRFRAIEIEQLGLRPVVQDLLALTRAAAHPADRLAWLAVLRAPWCGLELADLCALAEGAEGRTVQESITDASRLAHLSAGGRARLERVWTVLDGFVANRFRGGLHERVEGAWLALGGPACVDDTAL